MSNLNIFIISGEASGDLLGSKLVQEIKALNDDGVTLSGIGGEKLEKEGLDSIFPMAELSIMGFVEVVPKIPQILRRIKQTAAAIESIKPDIVISIDSPDFCFRVIKKVAKKNLPDTKFVHYVAPTVWAYREGRAKKIAALFDLLLVILPFEPPYFTKHNLDTKFIGHPIFSEHNQALMKPKEFDFENKKYLIVTTGSRRSEVLIHLPVFIKVIKKIAKDYPEMEFLFPTTSNVSDILERDLKGAVNNYKILRTLEEKEEAIEKSDYALAKSGTNTMENAFYNIAQVICYRVNVVTYKIAKLIVKIKLANLVNITAGREIIPELIQKRCNADEIYSSLKQLMTDKKVATTQIREVKQMLSKFSNDKDVNPAVYAAQEVIKVSKDK